MVEPNRVIKRTRHVIPTVEEIRDEHNLAKIFTKLYLANGFHHLHGDGWRKWENIMFQYSRWFKSLVSNQIWN